MCPDLSSLQENAAKIATTLKHLKRVQGTSCRQCCQAPCQQGHLGINHSTIWICEAASQHLMGCIFPDGDHFCACAHTGLKLKAEPALSVLPPACSILVLTPLHTTHDHHWCTEHTVCCIHYKPVPLQVQYPIVKSLILSSL